MCLLLEKWKPVCVSIISIFPLRSLSEMQFKAEGNHIKVASLAKLARQTCDEMHDITMGTVNMPLLKETGFVKAFFGWATRNSALRCVSPTLLIELS